MKFLIRLQVTIGTKPIELYAVLVYLLLDINEILSEAALAVDKTAPDYQRSRSLSSNLEMGDICRSLLSLNWLVRPWASWSVVQLAVFTVGTRLLLEELGMASMVMFSRAPRLNRASAKYEFIFSDHICIAINKLFAVAFNLYLLRYLYHSDNVTWGCTMTDFAFQNTLIARVCLVLLDDFMYYMMHRFLHWTPLYAYIHKHHHRELSPFKGC